MRIEPTISDLDITVDTAGEPYITDDFNGLNVDDPKDPELGIELPPIIVPATDHTADQQEPEADADSSNEPAGDISPKL